MTSAGTHALAARLHAQRDTFKAFLAARVGSAAEAEDILQTSLAKALQHGDGLRDDDKLTAWFHQVLRRAVIDHYRTRGAERRRAKALGAQLVALEEDTAAASVPGLEAQLCSCLTDIIATLPPHYAQLLQRVELAGEAVQDAARALGVSANRASVTLHRARQELRKRLEQFCGACADGACLDCDCAPPEASSSSARAH